MEKCKLTSASLIMAVVLAAPLEVLAQVPEGSSPRAEPHQKLLMIALDNYQKALCGGNQPCAPASTAERATPPITDEQARAIVAAASISVLAEHCQLDWERRNFAPPYATPSREAEDDRPSNGARRTSAWNHNRSTWRDRSPHPMHSRNEGVS
jgi:hypothetical protein